jgi:ribosomal protein L12E/L44/L45/RPP1/RPP2
MIFRVVNEGRYHVCSSSPSAAARVKREAVRASCSEEERSGGAEAVEEEEEEVMSLSTRDMNEEICRIPRENNECGADDDEEEEEAEEEEEEEEEAAEGNMCGLTAPLSEALSAKIICCSRLSCH